MFKSLFRRRPKPSDTDVSWSEDYLRLKSQYEEIEAPGATDVEYAALAASIHTCIWSHSSLESPLLLEARSIAERNRVPKDRALELLGVLEAFNDAVKREGYYLPIEQKEAYSSYIKFSGAVRAWFIAYGVGAVAVLATNDFLLDKIATGGYSTWVVLTFLAGVAIQVGKSILYKFTSWLMIDYAYISEDRQSIWVKAAKRINDSILLDGGIDIATVLLFIMATVLAWRSVCHISSG